MRIIEPCAHTLTEFGVTSSRWIDLPRVHIEDTDEAGGLSIYHGYDNLGTPIKESLLTPSAALTTKVQNDAAATAAAAAQRAIDEQPIADLKAQVATAINNIDSFLAIATPTNAQVLAEVKAIDQRQKAIIKALARVILR